MVLTISFCLSSFLIFLQRSILICLYSSASSALIHACYFIVPSSHSCSIYLGLCDGECFGGVFLALWVILPGWLCLRFGFCVALPCFSPACHVLQLMSLMLELGSSPLTHCLHVFIWGDVFFTFPCHIRTSVSVSLFVVGLGEPLLIPVPHGRNDHPPHEPLITGE